MAEIPSDVFDILHPSPVSLVKLSAMAINLEMWRREVDKYRTNCNLRKYNPFTLLSSSKTVFPHLPSTLYGLIDEYAARLVPSIALWLREHYSEGFHLHYSHQNDVLKDFDDFVCVCNGTIDYLKTAQRMMQCDRFDVDKKFIVACIYFFEDDIRRFWPLVREKIDLSAFNFRKSPLLYYWIRCLKNELDEIRFGTYNNNETLDEEMLDRCMYGNRRCVEYFWNRVPSENKMRKAEDVIYYRDDSFTRYILPKLNDQQISQLINTERKNLLLAWLEKVVYETDQILQLWMRYRNMINARCFEEALSQMLHRSKLPNKRYRHTAFTAIQYSKIVESDLEQNYNTRTYLTCEMWNSAPDHLKRSAIHKVLHTGFMFVGRYSYAPYDATVLLAILASATFEDRNNFWNSTWPKLICLTRGANLQRMMELCFNTQDEISQFKQNVLAKNDDVKNLCVEYLRDNCFEEANDLVDFCCPEIQTAKSLKQELLRSAFLSAQDSSLQFGTSFYIEEFNDFISNAFDSEDQTSAFKNDVILSPFFQHILKKMIPSQCKKLMQFVDASVSSKEILKKIKIQILEYVKLHYRKS